MFVKKMMTFLTLLCLSLSSFAQQGISQKFGQYEVFYSTFNTSFLSADVAKSYGIVRGKDKGLLNIAVIETLADGSTKNVSASMKGSFSDLIRKTPLVFQKVQEQEAIYYLAPFDVQHNNDVYFEITAQPDKQVQRFDVTFKKRMYVDGK